MIQPALDLPKMNTMLGEIFQNPAVAAADETVTRPVFEVIREAAERRKTPDQVVFAMVRECLSRCTLALLTEVMVAPGTPAVTVKIININGVDHVSVNVMLPTKEADVLMVPLIEAKLRALVDVVAGVCDRIERGAGEGTWAAGWAKALREALREANAR